MIIYVTTPCFIIDLDNRCLCDPDKSSHVNSKVITAEEYPNGFPELNEGDILFQYSENRGYILQGHPELDSGYVLKSETIIDIETLIKKWSLYGLNEGVDESKLSLLSYCYEKASLVLTDNMLYTDNNFNTVIFPIMRRIICKSNIDTTNTLNYMECDKFVMNLITDYNSYSKDYGKHIIKMLEDLTNKTPTLNIDIEAEIVRLYCEINDFNKILNKK